MRRSLGVAAVVSALLAVVVGEGGCEVAIGDTVPGVNYCNGGPDPCPQGQVCDPYRSHQCVPPCPKAQCPGNLACNLLSGTCQPADGGMMDEVVVNDDGPPPDVPDVVDAMTEEEATPPMETGPETSTNCPGGILCSCGGDAQCNSKLCVGSLAVGNGLYQAAGNTNFCSMPCCTSADCPTTPVPTVCYATGQGGNYCVSPEWIGRTSGSGTKQGGDTCTLGARECRSALCDNSQHCVDTCCSTEQAANECAGSDTCTFGNFPGANSVDKNYGAYCGSGGPGAGGSTCSVNSDCASYICALLSGESGQHCRDACRSAADCMGQYTCNYLIANTMVTPAPVVAACLPTLGNLAMGATCDPANDMCKGFCDPSSLKCTDVCFADTDCSGTVGGWRCRDETIAVQGGGSYSVLCCGT